jgi:NhaA family Na+:H+ antiporter
VSVSGDEFRERYTAVSSSVLPDTLAAVALPLATDGPPFGALGLRFTHARPLTVDDRDELRALGGQCAIALERARAFESERAARDRVSFLARAGEALDRFRAGRAEATLMLTDETQQAAVLELEAVCENVQAPLQKLEHRLHGWVAFFVMPVFALANAGVALSLGALAGETSGVVLGIVLGLVVGKPIGLVGATWVAVRSGITQLPAGVRWAHMVGAGAVAGIGFTMSLFVGTLAFGEGELLEAAKVGIITASVIAGVLGYVLLSRTRPVAPAAGTAAADLPPLPRSA